MTKLEDLTVHLGFLRSLNFYKVKRQLKEVPGQNLARSSTFSSLEYRVHWLKVWVRVYSIGSGSPDNSHSVKLPGVRSTLCFERRICIKSAQEQRDGLAHGVVNYKDTKRKCRHLKNWPVMGLCGRCLLEFIDWRYSQSCWYFRPSFVN